MPAMPRVERGSRHEHGGEADEAVEGGDELRHVCHRDLAGDDRANRAADGDAAEDQAPGLQVKL